MVCAAVAGCDNSIYVEVRVPPGMQADTVELFIAVDSCTVKDGEPCNGIAPPGAGGRHQGDEVYLRDLPEALVSSVGGDRSAWFKLASGDHRVPVIIAVGTIGTDPDQLEAGVAILRPLELSNGPLHLVADLVPARPLGDPKGNGVKVWRSNGEICVGADREPQAPVFIVSDFDRDCDGFTEAAECDPLAHLATITRPAEPPTCVRNFATSANGGACRLGAPKCTDGSPIAGDCGATNICVPSALCQCETSPAAMLESCLVDGFTSSLLRLECIVPAEPDVDGNLVSCTGSLGLVPTDLEATVFRGQADCGTPQFGSLQTPLANFSQVLSVDTGQGLIVDFNVKNQQSRCKFDLEWTAPASAVAGPAFRSIIAVPALNTTSGEDKVLILPLVVKFADCLQEARCEIVPDGTQDTISHCAD